MNRSSYSSQSDNRYPRSPVVLCSFYSRIGACRHGENCSKKHLKPISSRTILLANLYQNPKLNDDEYRHGNYKGNETLQLTEKEGVTKTTTEGALSQIDDSQHPDSSKGLNDETVETQEADTESQENIGENDDVEIKHNEDQKGSENAKESDNIESPKEVERDNKPQQGDTLEKVSEDNIKQEENTREKELENVEKDKLPEHPAEFKMSQTQHDFDQFFQDIFVHISKFGQISDIAVCENENNHLAGNVYVMFESPEDAYNANLQLNQEWYNGRPVYSELSPVSDFNEACCEAYSYYHNCERGAMCNYMHIRLPSRDLEQSLYESQTKSYILKQLEKLKRELPADTKPSASTNDEETNGNEKGISSTMALLEQLS
ncbi:spliceosomal factor U2AF small subunit, putative [Candida dubliniensis CD36]|uniref:Spliceosomal factor U2AF small subunit, putative n=1 Tax=Candida dubliniensis (strain CD36 / ATCC MYA-646 / CBS 7987 / NCPF 3949 / NRRL Y-17841) TaxID=573826 RepID=B9W7T1_CANDC|nr:spliceosomal factor U2AF small subunit, putative [Candida dubliniensis CD36]CAX44743.1 spliceosomal factor U2AF small subunit, putative [Candida dubliniensis CD36]